ncbi:shikimate kinase [Porphyromonas levii]|uniref:Shikimate kinase n=1 Tax=Porphyromonas levii TaxID=28114 RepID=A0A4Y8WRM6_9PORP|nr:shikimate kinase [Porphyromonas levii]MBR8702609.1 Shikimate kinase [Porphyromonas levii]MBR8712953.1 Shikimate kinase [Porphyromonas levii]MBR8715000.1 Shikimate kinase [Porphyromonas levii]MBR8727460.1 Shikimate kinase [Porphyromonas levii]MBR8730940.1 Shikimate kinase [Porphyromonas levii]
MKPIFLIGFTAVGKSTVGRKLAAKLGLPFVDTDVYIARKYHSSISDMMACCGVDKFRKREKVILLELAQYQDVVIATGGGMAANDDNIQTMKLRGTVIYLQASTEALSSRLFSVKESRPLVADLDEEGVKGYVAATLPMRSPYYEQAHHTIQVEHLDTPEDEDRVVEEILKLL